ncbi:MAG: transglutaminase-like domain-containing protein [Proteobacteria bacterium]|nr:transglutaminase-like domain-containing protein [Pseudomonadota bacterium]
MRFCQLKSPEKRVFFFFSLIIFFLSCNKGEIYAFKKPDFQIKKVIKDEYLGLFFTDKKIGYFQGTASDILFNEKSAYFLSGTGVIRLDLGQEKIYTVLKEEIILNESYRPIYFHYSQKIGESQMEIKGIRKGENLLLRTYSAGKYTEERLDGDIIPLSSAGFIVWKEGISEGKKYSFKVYVEAMQKVETLKVEIGQPRMEDGQKVYPLNQSLGNIQITSYVYGNGDTYKEESLQGFTLKKMSKETALKLDDSTSVYDILAYASIPVTINENPDIIKEIVFEISGIEKVLPPQSAYQVVKREGNRIIVKTSVNPLTEQKKINPEKYLKATPKIQSNDKEIAETARKIVADAKTDEEKVKKVLEWVNKNIKKSLKDRASALEVLKTKEGECEAHSMLTAGLLRSLGIPAKIVGGITYSEENKGFLYHAWNEVYLNGYFVPVDSTFGEYPANPTHIKLTEEENTEDISLYLGKLKLKIIEIKK